MIDVRPQENEVKRELIGSIATHFLHQPLQL
jgi:hypothetical protein